MSPRLSLLTVLLPLSLPLSGCASTSLGASKMGSVKAPGRYAETIGARKFTLIVPKSYDGSRKLPLVVLLHGWTSNGTQILAYTGMAAKAEKEGFLLAVPEGLGDPAGWNVGWIDLSGSGKPDDLTFVTKVIDQVEKETRVDEDRVFVAGHSNGAMLAHLVGSQLGDRIAAIGAMSGSVGLAGAKGRILAEIPEPKAPVSAILLHGKADPLVSYDGEHRGLMLSIGAPDSARWWAKHDGCEMTPTHSVSADGREEKDTYSGGRNGTEVMLVSYPEGKHLWAYDATDLIWRFFQAHPRKRS